jgi:hypothetical protein
MTRARGPKICWLCDRTITPRYPVFLTTTPDNRIVGPFHAKCAQEVVSGARELRARGLEPGIAYGRLILAAREETLPW